MPSKRKILPLIFLSLLLPLSFLWGCTPSTGATEPLPETSSQVESIPLESHPTAPSVSAPKADVLSVSVRGDPGAYSFSVEIRSPDQGCEQYADWWEVVDEDGNLIYRRILAHSHVNEQPFTRSGGPVTIEADTVVWVRAHMSPGGYGGSAFKGSPQAGFQEVELGPDFAASLEETQPLPDGCAF